MERRGADKFRELGERIRVRRLELGVSQEDLGDLAGLHRTYIGHLERGEINPSLLNVLRVAAALNVDAGELVRGLAQGIGDPRTA
ncbi:MAG: helix-turn-helix domain-containing protein [Acidimicrobiales bacterium]